MSSSTSGSELRRALVALACFAAALFAFDRGITVAAGALESRYYAGGNDFERQLASYLQGRSFDTLVLGTSRTNEGILTLPLESGSGLRVFKEAFQGKGPRYQLQFYRLFKRLAGRPALVVCGVDYFIYSIESDPRWLSRFAAEDPVSRPGLLAAPLLLRSQKHQHDLFVNNLVNDLNDRLTRTFVPAADLFEQIRRYTGVTVAPGNPRLLVEKPSTYERNGMPRPPGAEGKYFEQLIAEANADGVPVALVSLPDYVGTYVSNFELPLFHEGLRELSRRYPNVTVLIYDDPARFDLSDPSLFVDGGWGRSNSHLSAPGAAKFSAMLARDLKDLAIRSGRISVSAAAAAPGGRN